MEDRHSVSEPRLVSFNNGNTPSWEVDILRDEMVIVDTILLNNSVLPPRTNKRGKIVWRLPDNSDKLPSFGTDDRRRILDIFKERKKKRKQEKKKRNLSPPMENSMTESCDRRSYADTSHREKQKGNLPSTLGGNSEHLPSVIQSSSDMGIGGREPERKIKGKDKGNSAKGKENGSSGQGKENGNSSSTVSEKSSPQNLSRRQDGRQREGVPCKSGSGTKTHRPPLPSQSTSPPAGVSASPVEPIQHGASPSKLIASGGHRNFSHPTGVQPHIPTTPNSSPSLHTRSHHQGPSTPDPSCMTLDDQHDLPVSPQPQHDRRPSLCLETSSIQPPPSDSFFIIVPRDERPTCLPGQSESSLAVPAARHFIRKYYSHFDGTLPGAQIGDLIRYYTSKAQKSVSIGGAHSVVTGRGDIMSQVRSLAGASFVVRGVVAQDTADGKGVHILVTGTARTSLNGALGLSGVVASFAHSVSLAQIDEGLRGRKIGCLALPEAFKVGFPFQIHNDALALLSGEGPVTPTPIAQQVQSQQLPPPPPGLF